MTRYLTRATNFKPHLFVSAPLNALSGENLTEPAKFVDWFDGWEMDYHIEQKNGDSTHVYCKGNTLVEAIDTVERSVQLVNQLVLNK